MTRDWHRVEYSNRPARITTYRSNAGQGGAMTMIMIRVAVMTITVMGAMIDDDDGIERTPTRRKDTTRTSSCSACSPRSRNMLRDNKHIQANVATKGISRKLATKGYRPHRRRRHTRAHTKTLEFNVHRRIQMHDDNNCIHHRRCMSVRMHTYVRLCAQTYVCVSVPGKVIPTIHHNA